METNLRYGGDGRWDNTWGYADDRRSLALRSTGSMPATSAEYADPGGDTNYTSTSPTNGFRGYFYNWCATMGGQAAACQTTAATQPTASPTICPAGWGVPDRTEYAALNTNANSGSLVNDSGLRSNWLGVYSGAYSSQLVDINNSGNYWSSTVYDATLAYYMYHRNDYVIAPNTNGKNYGFAVRCVLRP